MKKLTSHLKYSWKLLYYVRDNIRFGQPDNSMEKVINAAKKAKCHDFIVALPNGYETVLGESGGTLSGRSKECCRKLEIINNKIQN